MSTPGRAYCSARYYDPVTCQFLAKDRARADGEESADQYCGGDPVGKTDPNGECDKDTFRRAVSRSVAAHLGIRSFIHSR
ncbi:MAG: hypothetical protein LLG08_05250 [Actinomycetia bacterium]|nr:hypothetical protein [Actinomycetes bacterium]